MGGALYAIAPYNVNYNEITAERPYIACPLNDFSSTNEPVSIRFYAPCSDSSSNLNCYLMVMVPQVIVATFSGAALVTGN